jgi:hypothetical protein
MVSVSVACLLLVGCALQCHGAPDELSLDGSTLAGSLSFNQYHYYYFSSPQDSGDVTITTTVTSGVYGVWTWVGTTYYPVSRCSV